MGSIDQVESEIQQKRLVRMRSSDPDLPRTRNFDVSDPPYQANSQWRQPFWGHSVRWAMGDATDLFKNDQLLIFFSFLSVFPLL